MGFRLQPILIFLLLLVLSIKVADMFDGGRKYTAMLLVSDLVAEESTEKEATASEDEKSKKSTDSASNKADAGKKEGKEAENSKPSIYGNVPDEFKVKQDDCEFSKTEVELLQHLSERRKYLVKWEKDIKLKEYGLETTNKRILDKIAQLTELKENVSALLEKYNEKEDQKIRSLVKIYESMKPKDAARIFEEVEMPILLQVVDQMKEAKAAPILAKMSPARARELTIELARNKEIKP